MYDTEIAVGQAVQKPSDIEQCLTVAEDIRIQIDNLSGRLTAMADRTVGRAPSDAETGKDRDPPCSHISAFRDVQDRQRRGLSTLMEAIERLEQAI